MERMGPASQPQWLSSAVALPILKDRSCRVTNKGSKKTVAPKPKRVNGQYFLDLGQKDFSYTTCSVCGLFYARGLEDDEMVHRIFHKNRTEGISFKGWQNERVVSNIDGKGNRVIVVLPEDSHHRHKVKEVLDVVEAELGLSPGWLIQKSCKVYLFISSSRKVVGCLMAEPIKIAFQVLPSKKQEVAKVQKVDIGQRGRSSLNCGGRSGACEATTSTGDQDQCHASNPKPQSLAEPRIDDFTGKSAEKVAGVFHLPNVLFRAASEKTTELSGGIFKEPRTSDGPSAWSTAKAGEEVSVSLRTAPAVAPTFVSTMSRTWKITDFFEQRSIPSRVVMDNEPTTSGSSCLSVKPIPPIRNRTGKEKGLVDGNPTGTRLSKISDYFVPKNSKCSLPEGYDILHDTSKAGATVTTGPVDGKEGKNQAILGEHTLKLESMTGVPGDLQLEEEQAEIASFELESKDVVGEFSDSSKARKLDESLQETELESRVSSSGQCVSCASSLYPKMEVKEEIETQSSGVHATLNSRRTADLTSEKSGVQEGLKNEVEPKAELDGVQEGREKGEGFSCDVRVQKSPFKQASFGANILLFGNVKLYREVIPRKRSCQEHAEELCSAVMYNTRPIPAVCGVRIIWVSNSERRKGIASHLLDAMRKSFCFGAVLEPTQFAFSQPTTDGRKFAARYCKTDEFLIREPKQMKRPRLMQTTSSGRVQMMNDDISQTVMCIAVLVIGCSSVSIYLCLSYHIFARVLDTLASCSQVVCVEPPNLCEVPRAM